MLKPYFRLIRDNARHRFVLGAFLALAACSGKDEPKYPTTASYCAARAEAECSKEVLLACAIPDQARCITKRQDACFAAYPNGMPYNPNGAEPCVTAVAAAFADAKISSLESRTMREACVALFDGPGVTDATCREDIDCKVSASLRCVLRGGSLIGTCQVPQVVTGGGVCSALSQSCVAGYHCGPTDHCDVNSQVGEACRDVFPCVEIAYCNTGKCEKKLEDGTPCSSDQQCLSAMCLRGIGASQGLCASQMTLAPNEPFCVEAR
jgi:hypothetical protein